LKKKDIERKSRNRERLINYSSRLTVLVQGCQSINCPFSLNSKEKCGTADVCDCYKKAKDLAFCIGNIIEFQKNLSGEIN
jgi:hypothetical protein